MKGERHPEADYREVYNDFANNYMKRKVWDMSVSYVYQITDWMKLKERFSYFHSDLDYHCIEGLSYRTSKDPIYKWYYNKSETEKVYVDLDTVQRGNAARLNPLNFNPDHKNVNNTIELTGKFETGSVLHNYTLGYITVSILPNITVTGRMICGDPVWMPFYPCGTRTSCKDGGIRKFLPFLFVRKERMEFICMT